MKYNTYEEALEAVKINALNIFNVDKKFKTPELWMEAVKQHGYITYHIPKELQSLELCIMILQHNPRYIIYMENKSQDLIDYCKLMNIPIRRIES